MGIEDPDTVTNEGVPSIRVILDILAKDPGDYFKDHYGCVAYIGGEGMPYKCCNNKIEDFDLTKCRAASLRVLTRLDSGNTEDFIRTLQCRNHSGEHGDTYCMKRLWLTEMAHALSRKGYCTCCSTLPPRPRWDAGFIDRHRARVGNSDVKRGKSAEVSEPRVQTAIDSEGTTESANKSSVAEHVQTESTGQSILPDDFDGEATYQPQPAPSSSKTYQVQGTKFGAVGLLVPLMVSVLAVAAYEVFQHL